MVKMGDFQSNDKRRLVILRPPLITHRKQSALAGLKARVHFVDDVDTTLTADDPAIAVPGLECLQRIGDLHNRSRPALVL